MANGKTHLMVGGTVCLALYVIHHKFVNDQDLTIEGVLGTFSFGAVGGLMADRLEPATNPHHRKFFHSMVFAAIALLGKDRVCQVFNLTGDGKRYFDWFLSCYGSHLFLDAQTPMGLPIL